MEHSVHEYIATGFHLAKEGKWSQAIEAFNEALCLEPDDFGAIMNRCRCHTKLNQFDDALADADRLIEMKPNYWRGYWLRGNILTEMGRKDEANESHNTAISKLRSQRESN